MLRSKAEKITSAVILVMACLIPLYSPMIPRATFGIFPLKEVEFLKINNIKGNILVPFEMGSYVSYKLYPNNLIYMDGRYEEVYYPDTLEDLMEEYVEKGERGFQVGQCYFFLGGALRVERVINGRIAEIEVIRDRSVPFMPKEH